MLDENVASLKKECASAKKGSCYKKLKRRDRQITQMNRMLFKEQTNSDSGCKSKVQALKKRVKELQTTISKNNQQMELHKMEKKNSEKLELVL